MVVFSVFAPKNQKTVMEGIEKQIEELASKGPSDEELARAKEVLKSQWYFGNETFHDQASLSGYWELQKNPAMVEKYIPGIAAVTKKDVSDFLKKYYSNYGLSTAVISRKK
jgi:predicted Zn-dependent peptidase